jgi:hypothetical protein
LTYPVVHLNSRIFYDRIEIRIKKIEKENGITRRWGKQKMEEPLASAALKVRKNGLLRILEGVKDYKFAQEMINKYARE